MQVGQHTPLHGAIKLVEFLIELIGGLPMSGKLVRRSQFVIFQPAIENFGEWAAGPAAGPQPPQYVDHVRVRGRVRAGTPAPSSRIGSCGG